MSWSEDYDLHGAQDTYGMWSALFISFSIPNSYDSHRLEFKSRSLKLGTQPV